MKRRARIVLLVVAGMVGLGVAGGVAGYLIFFHKNPAVVRQIKDADQKQKELDAVFDSPTPPAAPSSTH